MLLTSYITITVIRLSISAKEYGIRSEEACNHLRNKFYPD